MTTRSTQMKGRKPTVAALVKHLKWCCDTLENAASVIVDYDGGDDIDGEGAEVRARVKEIRELIGYEASR